MKTCEEALRGAVVAVLNTNSGSCDATSADQARAILREAEVPHAEIVEVGPGDLESALRASLAMADVLIVLGGDGTIGTAASLCRGPDAPLLVPLPGGTMNMLPKALYGSRTWQSCLAETLKAPSLRQVSGGELAGRRFFCAAILGAPSLWADAREAVREGHLLEAARQAATAARRSLTDQIAFDFGSMKGIAEAVAVICPLVSAAMSEAEETLEAVALKPTAAADFLGLALHAASDGWRNDPSVRRTKTQVVRVKGHDDLPVLLDGERVEVGSSAAIEFIPRAFRAIVAAGSSAASD